MHATGLVIGKFYPPHRGHKYLIDTAMKNASQVIVLVCDNPAQAIPAALRAEWIRKIHPGADVRVIPDAVADDDSEGWANYVRATIGFAPDAVFTSEDYGDPFARFLGCAHVCVDKKRATVPISGTAVRQDPLANLDYLEPCVRDYFLPRVCVLGAESTGTTTLSRALAEHYRTAWVPEYGRTYCEGKFSSSKSADWNTGEFVHIARTQCAMEDALAATADRLLVCDTNAFATGLWHERYLETRSAEVEAVHSGRRYALYILTGDEIPFVQDGIRDGEHIRHAMQRRFVERLDEEGFPYVVVTGSPEERLATAIAEIERRIPS